MKTYVMEEMPETFWVELKVRNLQDDFSCEENWDAEITIIRTRTKFDRALIDKFSNLKMIIRAGSGYDNIDVDYAQSKNIAVCNTPEANAYSAYEHTLALIFGLIKNLQYGKQEIETGNWKKKHPSNWEIPDLKVLVVGLGRVGTRVAKTLEYLGAKVLAVDPELCENEWQEKGISPIHYIEGLKWCNLVTYHCPLYSDTFHYFNQKIVDGLDKPIWLVNAARGKVVDFIAVNSGLDNNKLFGVALDVFEEEPWQSECCINNPRFMITPHTGAFTTAAKDRMSIECVDVWQKFVEEDVLISPVDARFIYRK